MNQTIPKLVLDLTDYNTIKNNSLITLNQIQPRNFNKINGANFTNMENRYILIPLKSIISLRKPYTISFSIYALSYDKTSKNYIFNQGMIYNKDNRYMGTGLGITFNLVSGSNMEVNIYEDSIGFPQKINIPVFTYINVWTKIVIQVTPTSRGNSYIISVNGINYSINSKYVDIDLALTQITNIILGDQLGNGTSFNGYIKDFEISQ
jgi:hypothetical protein